MCLRRDSAGIDSADTFERNDNQIEIMRILVGGLIGQYAFGGVTWDYIQYPLGFRALGHDVWYLEDTASWAYDPIKEESSADCTHNVTYLGRIMRVFDMGDLWIYHRNEADGKYYGVTDERLAEKRSRRLMCW